MNVRDFEYIAEIAKTRSISKAADHLYVSQPTISKFLQRIEEELQTPLFRRMGRQLVPTPAGECVIEKSKEILALNDQMLTEVKNLLTYKLGNIRLGIPASRGSLIITSVLSDFKRLFPNIKLTVQVSPTAYLIKQLEQNDFDLIMINYTTPKSNLHYQKIGQDEMILAVPAGSHLLKKAEVRPGRKYPCIKTEHWINEPFVLPGNTLVSGRYSREVFQRLNASPPVSLEIESLDQALLAVRNGLGNTIVPSIPLRKTETQQPIAYLCIEGEYKPIGVAIVTQKGKCPSEPEQALINMIEKEYQKG